MRAISPPATVLDARGVSFTRAGQRILTGVDLSLSAGERVAVVGPSGSGKTSLLMLLAGIERPDDGSVHLDGQPLTFPHPAIALVLQGYALLPLLTAAENVEVALRAAGHRPRTAVDRAAVALGVMDVGSQGDQLSQDLSGGQAQRVAVARALALERRVLLADEPTAEQDPAHRELVIEQLLAHVRDDGALVIATHDQEVAGRCDRVVDLHHGRPGR